MNCKDLAPFFLYFRDKQTRPRTDSQQHGKPVGETTLCGVIVGVDACGMSAASLVIDGRLSSSRSTDAGARSPSIVMPHTKSLYVHVRRVIRRTDYVQHRRTAIRRRCYSNSTTVIIVLSAATGDEKRKPQKASQRFLATAILPNTAVELEAIPQRKPVPNHFSLLAAL